jgi:uncharacterized protein
MIKLFPISILSIFLLPFSAVSQNVQLKSYPLSAVSLLDSPFKKAQQTDLNYILEMDPDRLLAPFLREAGLEPKAKSYENWENTGLDGHIGGHYLSALAMMYSATENPELKERLEYMLNELEKCQVNFGNGYLGAIPGGKDMWTEIKAGKIDADNFSLNKKWVPWYNIHKTYSGLRDAYWFSGNEKAKEMLIKLSEWCLDLTANLSDEQFQTMLRCEYGGMNEIFVDVYEITGDYRYLELAKKFSHKVILKPLLNKEDKLNGLHANTQIPKVIGFMRVAEATHDHKWAEASDFFWNNVVNYRTVSIGGNSVREHFHPSNNFSSMLESKEGPETCNTYNMLKLSRHLFMVKQGSKYIEYYERALYNHILSSQHPEGGFVYFTPMRPRHYRVYSQPHEGFWCCVGSGLENHAKYGEMIYAHDDKDIFLNLFIPSVLNDIDKGITLTQETSFPFEEATLLKLKLHKSKNFRINVRIPEWVKKDEFEIRINGKKIKFPAEKGYAKLKRTWKNGDVITVALPMQTKVEFLPDNSSWASFIHGPIVLAAATERTDLGGLKADDSRMGHIANGPNYPIEEAPVIISEKKETAKKIAAVYGKPLTFKFSDGIFPAQYQSLELVPFFQIHDSRYMLYWKVTTQGDLEKTLQVVKDSEQKKMALEEITLDQIAPGEQQPEADHNFKGDKTEAGVHQDRHWRHASGWFSYELKNKNREAKVLRLTYFGLDNGRNFNILVNNKIIANETLKGDKGNSFFDVDYHLPEDIAKEDLLDLRFEAKEGSIAGGIFYIRLLKGEK